MNERSRLLTALSGGEPDRVPTWELMINQPVVRSILGEAGRGLDDTDAYLELAEKLGIEGLTAFESMEYSKVEPGVVEDEWGIKYGLGNQGEKFPLAGPVDEESDLEGYQPPDPKADRRWRALGKMKTRFGKRKAVAVCIHDAFEYPWFLRGGMGDFLMDLYREPEFVKSLIELVVDYNVELIENAAELGADFVCSGDDYAYNKGPLVSPRQFEEFFYPGVKRVVEAAHEHDMLFLKHSDGDIRPLLDRFVDADIDALCPLEPRAGLDIGEIKSEYGTRMALVGNIDCTELLVNGTEEEVRRAVRNCISSASPGVGHVLSSSNSIHHDVDPDNYLTVLDALREFGRYPIDQDAS